MRSGDKTILASFPNPCSDNNSPSLPVVSCPSLPHPPPHLPLPQAEWKGVTVLGLTLSTWCQGEEEEEVVGEVPRGHIIVLEYVKQYWHTAEVTYHCTELGTGRRMEGGCHKSVHVCLCVCMCCVSILLHSPPSTSCRC